jgi:hypothetical protein
VNTPTPFASTDAGGCIAEGPLLTPHQSEIDLSRDGDELLSNPIRMEEIQKESKQEYPKISDDEVPRALLSLCFNNQSIQPYLITCPATKTAKRMKRP